MLVSPILVVDSLNVFLRAYHAYPSMNETTGEHMGGIVGFIKMLKRIIDDMQPSRVYVVWEGGGSSKRRSLYSEYKANRKPGKLNRFYEDDIPDTPENKLDQVATLIKLLKTLPLCQLYVSDVEADDVIAFLVKRHFPDHNKVILSTDKDMYQLLDEKTEIYDMNKKSYVTSATVKETYMIPPRNFALAKTLCGDGSDNIPGIKGCGFKTVARRFPLLLEDKDVLLQDVIDYAHTRVTEATVYKNVSSAVEMLKINWRLVYLDGSMLSPPSVKRLENVIKEYAPTLDKMALLKSAMACGIANHIDINGTAHSMRALYYTYKPENKVNDV